MDAAERDLLLRLLDRLDELEIRAEAEPPLAEIRRAAATPAPVQQKNGVPKTAVFGSVIPAKAGQAQRRSSAEPAPDLIRG